jgi:hypothetical protein
MNYYTTKQKNTSRRLSFTKYLTGLILAIFKLEYQ